MTDILMLLEENAPKFSRGQKAVAAFIREHYAQAALMTAAALGKTAGVSESTVVRFAMELGFAGYPDMQKALQANMVQGHTEAPARTDFLSVALQRDMELLRRTDALTDRAAFDAAVEAILGAKRLFVWGCGEAAHLAAYLGYSLGRFLEAVRLVSDSSDGVIFEQILDADRSDALIVIDLPSHPAITGQVAEYCRSKGTRVIGITDSSLSALGKNCDRVLLVGSDSGSLTAPMSLVSALIGALASHRETVLRARQEELKEVWNKYRGKQ